MRLEDQTEEAFQEDFGVTPQTSEPKGKGYIELLVDNIVGLDNEYESFGEAFGKSFNEDELGTLKNMAVSAYEGAKEFATSPIETTKDVATEISDSVSRLGAESLDGRIKRMYGVGYQDATEEQVTKAREAVIGDAITASSLVPAAKGVTTVAKAAIPGKPLNTSVEDIINAEDFEPLDENFIPVNKPSAESLKSEIDYMLGEELTPQEGLSKIKKTNLEDLGLYKKGTVLGDAALDKDKIFSSLKDEELLKLAEDLPHWEDAKYSNYLKNTLVPVSKKTGADWSNLLETLNDISSYLPTKENPQLAFLTEKPLPKKAPVGERAATGSAPRAADPKAEQLGFLDTVYHTSVSPQEFTEFDLQKGFSGEVRAAQDLLGVHVGTARAAAERNFQAYRKDDTPKGFTMELRARATDPLTKGDLARMFGKAPEDIFSSGNTPLTESDIGEAISFYEDMLFQDKQPPKEARKIAAVAFRRELAREGFTHIPYINSVEDPGSISYIMLVDRPKDSPAVLRDVRAQFDPKKVTSPDLRFAEGGMVEEDQMNRLMQEGGIADDGMTREPVTGNEIPPGSMASEVRDDIPAQLSEGEYIVPADVVRFFGVRFFEDLRSQAKQGLQEMDADGRIGGTPVDAQGVPVGGQDEELTPEEQQMLMEALGASGGGAGMAYGGMITQTPANPYPLPDMSVPVGMAEGGMPDRTQFSLGTGQTGIQQRKYINPTTKEERTINFLNDTPLGIVPEGFVPWTQELADAVKAPETETPTTATEKVEREGRDRDQQGTGTSEKSYEGWAKENYDAITSDPYGFGVNAINDASKQATGFGRVFSGGIIGDFQKMEAISDAQAALSRVTDEAQKQDLQSRIDALTGSISSPIVGLLTDIGFTATGKQKNAAINAITNPTTATRNYQSDFSIEKTREAVAKGTFDKTGYEKAWSRPSTNVEGRTQEERDRTAREREKDLAATAKEYEKASRGDAGAIGPDYDPYSDKSIWNTGGLVPKKQATQKTAARKSRKGLAS
jgi:hypothetical protein